MKRGKKNPDSVAVLPTRKKSCGAVKVRVAAPTAADLIEGVFVFIFAGTRIVRQKRRREKGRSPYPIMTSSYPQDHQRRVWSTPDATQQEIPAREARRRWKSFEKVLAGDVKHHQAAKLQPSVRPAQAADWQTETANGLSSTPSTNLSRDKPPEEPPVAGKQTNSSPSEQRNISKVPTSRIFSHQRCRATSKTFPILRTIDLGDRTLPQSLEKPPPEPSKVAAASHCSRVRRARLLQSLPASSENP